MGRALRAEREAPVQREEGAAQDDVHGDEVKEEGQLQQGPQQAHGRRQGERVGEGDHGRHRLSSVSGASVAGLASPGAVAARPPRYCARARRSSSVPEKGGISSRTCGSRPIIS